MTQSVSILVPTHNRSDLVAQVLESLESLRVPDGVDVELIVVANGCQDDTEAVVAAAAPRLPFDTRCVVENELGLNVARNRCANEARGEILAFFDDDVWVDPDWLIGLCEVYDNEPADVVGGRTLLWWSAVEAPSWMDARFEVFFSGSDLGDERLEIDTSNRTGMVGANFSFRREVWERLESFKPGLDRVGGNLLAGGETEFLRRAGEAGFRFFYAPRATVKHMVSPDQVELTHMLRASYEFGRTHSFLNASGSTMRALGALLGQPLRAMANLASSGLAGLARNQVSALSRRLAATQRIGRCVGAWQLLTRRSPVHGRGQLIAARSTGTVRAPRRRPGS